METRLFYGILMMAFIAACTPKVHLVKGKFFDSLILGKERYFSHSNQSQTNTIKKITQESGYGYYAWKTIAYNYEMSNAEILKSNNLEKANTQYVSIYKTILNKELMALKANELTFVQREGRVLANNLYFLDDHRCVYISFDDDRVPKEGSSILPLFFDGESYPVKKKYKKLFEQYLRGYYTLTNDSIFIHFHQPFSNVDYFVHGLIEGDAITFTSMTIPTSPNNIYEGGYNAIDVDLKKVFHAINLPVFEWVRPVKDIFYPKQTYLSTGFELHNGEKKNKMHERILNDCKELKDKKEVVISDIQYATARDTNGYLHRVRKYTLKELYKEKTFEVLEYIGLNEMSECMLETW